MEKPSAQLQELIVSIWKKNLRVHDVSKDLENNPEVKKYLNDIVQSDEWFINIRTALTLCAKGIYEKQYCLNCKKELSAKDAIHGKKYCSCKCNCSSCDTKAKINKTNLEKYGTIFPNQNEQIKSKRKTTNIKKYGVSSFSKTQEFHEKFKQACLKKYGVENVFQNDEIIRKANIKRKQKIGCDYTFQRHEVQLNIIRKRQNIAYSNIVNKIKSYAIPLFTEKEYHGHQNHEVYTWKCKHCNNEFESEIYYEHYINGQKINCVPVCPFCFPFKNFRSKAECALKQFLQSLYDGTIQINNRHVLKNHLELDLYIPELKIAFEFDGVYWHDIDNLNKHKNNECTTYHLIKTEKCEELNIHLIHIFENEWIFKYNQLSWFIKERIASNLFMNIKNEIYHIQKITKHEYFQFMKQNAIVYEDDIDESYGMILNNTLIFACGINHINFNNKSCYNISGFSSKIDCNFNGMIPILFTYLKTLFNNILITLDRRFYDKQFIFCNQLNLIHTSSPAIRAIQFNDKTYHLYDCGNLICSL